MTWILKSYSAAPVMNNRSILARLARLIICSVHMHLKNIFFLYFFFHRFTKGVQNRVLLAERQTACFDEEKKKKIFSALLMINVLIFLDMVWFGF